MDNIIRSRRMKELDNQFDELIKTLILLRSPAEKQIEYSGDLTPFGDDVIVDFEECYSNVRNEFLENNYISMEQSLILDKLDKFTSDRSGEEFIDFWTNNELLKTDPDWDEIRKLANDCLTVLHCEGMYVEIKIVNDLQTDENGKKYIIQRIKTDLKDM